MRTSRFLQVLFLMVLVCVVSSAAAGDQQRQLTYRVWQFHDEDAKYLQSAIGKAKEAGMNRIQLSHKIIMNIHELFGDEKLELVRRAARVAHEQGLAVDVWTHELDKVPGHLKQDKRVVLNDALWSWLQERYKKAFELVPEIDGVVLTYAETEYKVYGSKIVSDLSRAGRISKLIDVIADVCQQYGKTLFVRTFVYEPDELQAIEEALAMIAKTAGQRGNVVVMSKCVPHDWTPYYPYNPLLGRSAGLPQIVEIDLGQEFTGKSKILHCEVGYVKYVLRYARSKGVVGAVARVERRNNQRALDTPNEVNIHAFGRLLDDPTLSTEKLWYEWVTKRYGQKAAPHVIEALKPTFEITNLTFFPLEYWITNHSLVPDWSYAYGHITSRQNAKWIASPKQELARDELLHPTRMTLMKINSEKDLALKLSELSLQELEKAKVHLSKADYVKLRHYLEFGRDNVEVFRRHNLAMFTTIMFRNARKEAALAESKQLRDNALGRVRALREVADVMQKKYGEDIEPGNPRRIRNFADELEKMLGTDQPVKN